MYDDGTNGDVAAGDSIFSTIIPAQPSGTLVKYYAIATDSVGQQDSWPKAAPAEYHAYTVDHKLPKLRITELLAVNNSVNADEFGEYDDWLEIHNEDSMAVDLANMYVSNSLQAPKSFVLPSLSLAPGKYLVLWADNDIEQGSLHLDFKLSSAGEEVAIFETAEHGKVLIHGWKYGIMSADVSMGFLPQSGTAPEYLLNPTLGASNETSELFSPICINEFLTTSNFGGPDDWVEIYNRSDSTFNLSGCFLSDELANRTKWTFPQGTTLDPDEYLVIYENALGFGFSSDGKEVIMLTAADSITGLDFYDFGQQQSDKSEGRFPDGSNTWKFFDKPTRGESNSSLAVVPNPTKMLSQFILQQNYPNPFNASTQISFSLPATEKVALNIYNLVGQKVSTLMEATLPAGNYAVPWKPENMPTGLYFYQLVSDSHTLAKKMILSR